MARIGYSEDEDYPGQFNIWQANCRLSLQGKAGQAVLRELEAALVAMPQKRLIRNAVACDGDVCAVGAYLVAVKARQGVSRDEAQRQLEAEMGEREDQEDIETDELGIKAGMPRLVAWKLVALNDIELDGHYEYAEGPDRQSMYPSYAPHRGVWTYFEFTPEERYEKVLAFVREQLRKD